MAKPMQYLDSSIRLIIGVTMTLSVASFVNITPSKGNSKLISCPTLAKKFSIGAINFDAQKKCISDTGPVMTYERWCSRAPGVVCPVGRG